MYDDEETLISHEIQMQEEQFEIGIIKYDALNDLVQSGYTHLSGSMIEPQKPHEGNIQVRSFETLDGCNFFLAQCKNSRVSTRLEVYFNLAANLDLSNFPTYDACARQYW